MFKNENDKISESLAPNALLALRLNSNSSLNQWTIITDASVGLMPVMVTPRLGIAPEPLLEADGATPVVIDLSDTRRTLTSAAGYKEISIQPTGMDGTYYKLAASGGGL